MAIHHVDRAHGLGRRDEREAGEQCDGESRSSNPYLLIQYAGTAGNTVWHCVASVGPSSVSAAPRQAA